MTETPLDRAHAAMEAGGDHERLRFYERLADAELFMALVSEAGGDRIEPQTYLVSDQSYVLVFDLIERMSDFAGGAVPYAAMSGRAAVDLLAGQGIGIALNLGPSPSAILLPATAVDWLASILRSATVQVSGRPVELRHPFGIAAEVLDALHVKLSLAAGLAQGAYLAEVEYEDGQSGLLLGFVDVVPGAEGALRQAMSEALIFSGTETAGIDLGFFDATDPVAARLARVGLGIEWPEPPRPSLVPTAPGTDPKRPPKLR